MTFDINNIFIAIQNREDDSIKDFLQRNGVDYKDAEQRTALINAAFYNNLDLIKWLIEVGADINAQDAIGFTALHFACQEGHLDCVKLLLSNHANIDITDIYGNTPAWVTIMNWKGGRNLSILKELYLHNADLSIKNNAGNSAINIIPKAIVEQLNNEYGI